MVDGIPGASLPSSVSSSTTATSSDVATDNVVKEQQRPQQQQRPVQVYVRIRPLIQEEEGHTEMEYNIINNGGTRTSTAPTVDNDNEGIAREELAPTRKEQQQEEELHVKIPGKKRTMNPAFQQAHLQQEQQQQKPLPKFLLERKSRDDWKIFKGITNVLDQNYTNEMVYQKTIQPVLLEKVLFNNNSNNNDQPKPNRAQESSISSSSSSLCVFTYGHTGSGKSHTLLGYDDKGGDDCSLGIYKYTIHDLFHHLKMLQDDENDNTHDDNNNADQQQQQDGRMILLIRITELYTDNMIRDLLTGDDCTIREDKHKIAHVRGPLIEDVETGMIDQRPLGQLCYSSSQAIQCIDDACKNRRVGISTHHDQSSRSHLVVEIEICTRKLIDQRNLLMKQETHLTRLMWLQTERTFSKHKDKVMPKWTNEYNASPMKLRKEIKQYETLIEESQIQLKELEVGHQLLGTSIVFCDLAGNEYAKDSVGSTKEEMDEAATINKSLLAVKEMIRTLNNNNDAGKKNHHHVKYRDSKLSMLLKRHFVQVQNAQTQQGVVQKQKQIGRCASKEGGGTITSVRQRSTSTSTSSHHHHSYAIMMGHISPSSQYIRKTLNTLTYCQMVGHHHVNNNNNNNNNSKNGITGGSRTKCSKKTCGAAASSVNKKKKNNSQTKSVDNNNVIKAAAVSDASAGAHTVITTTTITTTTTSSNQTNDKHDRKKDVGKENQP